jgi:hypothetical protein
MAEPIDSERSCALTSTMGEKATGKGSFGRLLPFNRWRRERGGGYPSPACRRQPTDGSRGVARPRRMLGPLR